MASKRILNYAINQASLNTHEYKIIAVLHRGGSIIRSKFNTSQYIGYRSDVFAYSPTRHAEQSVLHNVPRDILLGCNVLVIRINRKGQLTSAKPCRACISALKKAGISKVEYSNYRGEIEKINAQLIDIDNWKKEISGVK